MGVQTEVMAFRETSSSKLVEEVDDYIDLSKDQQRYLIPTRFTGRAPAAGKSQARAPKPAPTADDGRSEHQRDAAGRRPEEMIPFPRGAGGGRPNIGPRLLPSNGRITI